MPEKLFVPDKSPYVHQKSKIKYELNIRELPWTDKQKELINLILDKNTKMVFIKGPAGTSKTIIGTYCGLKLLNKKSISDILYVRTVAESASKGLGYLPGETEDKFQPFIQPLEDKLDELLPKGDVKTLFSDKRIQGRPVNYLRGASFNAIYLLCDETQNLDFPEIVTLITRMGKFSKFILCGDETQSDINGKSGFSKIYNAFNNKESEENGIICFEFLKEDVVRSEELKYILTVIEKLKSNKI